MNHAYLQSCYAMLTVLYVVDIPHRFCAFETRVSFGSSSKSETSYIAQAGTERQDLPAFPSQSAEIANVYHHGQYRIMFYF